MGEMSHEAVRDAVRQLVYRRLADRSFRERLAARAGDGSRPVLIAMPHDALESTIQRVRAQGGAANVVLPLLNGIVVIVMRTEEFDANESALPRLASDCTLGLFFSRLHLDGNDAAYRFVVDGTDRQEGGRAEAVAVAG
jgi:hypothetical protein